ncbi:sulfite exporter TauE/SafE family protein [Nitrogeniibacter mangrovi]|uniref:Sulfite exporter TauE/SafE family protein n=1 Tax=Nitrogeniibacter mangrovi TaxID=2016596 RepID=A0A6C1B6E2_9RHOO|nr:sulfite exporter TauE/SafE family protein [Nitrogeniibacter mangrovi]QID19003.1 sulfite exporter TauE/SafE family protein [Nitrogeniibacter mangrovi]
MSPDALAALIAPDGHIGLAGALVLGLSMGLTACTVTCLPYMGTWALGRAGRGRETLVHTGAFVAGRVAAYTALGALAGQLGQWLVDSLQGPLGQRAIGGASLFAGLWLMLAERRAPRAAPPTLHFHPRRHDRARACAGTRLAAAPPFLMGAALSLTPCAPLGWLIGMSAATGSLGEGLARGLAFGLGAGITPLLLLVPAAGVLGRRLRRERAWLGLWLRVGAGGVLIFLGSQRLFSA